MIPAEAVEAAAKVLWDKEMNAPWSSVADGFKAPFLRDARAALEAAAPYIRAQALEEAAVAAADPSPEDMDTYFIDQADVGRWLNARAAAEAAPYMLNNEGEK